MSSVLFDLEETLRAKKDLTLEEEAIMEKWKSKAVGSFFEGVLAGSAIGALATVPWKLHKLLWWTMTSGAVTIFAFRRFRSSIHSSLDDILASDRTRMQRELANIIVKKYRHEPLLMQLISKNFYSEEVYDDSSSELQIRCRYRNFFSDISYDQETDNDSQNDSHKAAASSDSHKKFDSKRIDSSSKQIPVDSGVDLMEDPLDFIFGHTATTEENHHSTTSSVPSRAQRRTQKRAQHRGRLSNQEGSSGSFNE
ncbi:hypothetical protein CCACVL1_12774 [Corchorus capsularis]|uniref:Uncharacterized protein n=1 Tax=Corchorus capsularis TaxID=210143 RepID=A0A1R3IE20_COCAP|nr:hypothetical protein CCACVL1_12774 [Corchorus capsularis]